MEQPKKKYKGKWRNQYRLVVLNDDTFEERFSLKLTRLNVFTVTLVSAVLLVGLTTFFIAFTPVREFIPGYSDSKVRNETTALLQETDSLKARLALNEQQYDRIKMVLSGDITSEEYARIDSVAQAETTISLSDFTPSREDSLLREEVAREDKFNLIEGAKARTNFVFFKPVVGKISNGYSTKDKHYGVDVTTAVNTPVKAAAAGTVVFSGWSAETGYTILLEHSYGLITVYKHCGTLTKSQNDQVLAGEVIASVGNTGELTNGPHLHFELWSDGYALDPINFINFE
ncbi:Peptidase family M23 [Nonlabens sp. Hel1_33_55]|uniref:M23 family metallopeptidase n=1 Tax=Nonlabens sp. Hel1_33_55 TaxID=1336802 RepID=UPI000875E27B|nr:M23 family metallopeptidase [Nonlabens sp. Hel1_33_55]SCY33136.1 Peptidase family M23 [Nonlabens sp. Hel1_33_55]